MKTKIVIWSTDENEQKHLLAIQLDQVENQINIFKFPEAIVAEDFYKALMNQWKNNEEVTFPEGYETLVRPLSVTDNLLPDNLKVDRPDIVTRAKAEWHFVVLSSKLYELYSSELVDIKEKVDKLDNYSSSVWEEMKGFWNKVQDQVREKNLFREHANELRSSTNTLFDKLKEMRKTLDSKFREESKEQSAFFYSKVTEIKEKIQGGKSLQPLFEELKKLQSTFTKGKFTKEDRSKIWNKIDAAFKELKEKKYGKAGAQSGGNNNALARLENRYQGLIGAISRMKNSIDRDLRDKNPGNRAPVGQLEEQLRQAKAQMIDERVASKQVKMKDMLATKVQLESKIEKEKQREERRKEQAEIKARTEAKKKEIKDKIASTSVELDAEVAAKLAAAAAAIKEGKTPAKKSEKQEENKIVDEPAQEEVKQEVVDAVEAKDVAIEVEKKDVPVITSVEVNVEDVLADKIAKAKGEEANSTKENEVKEESGEETISDKVEDVIDDVTEVIEDVVDSLKSVASVAIGKVTDFVEKLNTEEEE